MISKVNNHRVRTHIHVDIYDFYLSWLFQIRINESPCSPGSNWSHSFDSHFSYAAFPYRASSEDFRIRLICSVQVGTPTKSIDDVRRVFKLESLWGCSELVTVCGNTGNPAWIIYHPMVKSSSMIISYRFFVGDHKLM